MSRSTPRFPVRVTVVMLSGESLPDASRCVLSVVLSRHEQPGGSGLLSLPSAFREAGETLEESAKRALEQIKVGRPRSLQQIETTASEDAVTITYLGAVDRLPMAGINDTSTQTVPITDLQGRRRNTPLDDQDEETLKLALAELGRRLEASSLALSLVPTVFTLGQLRSIYEDAWDKKLDLRNFRRKVLEGPRPFVEPVGASLSDRGTKGRPPELYRATRAWDGGVPVRRPRRRTQRD